MNMRPAGSLLMRALLTAGLTALCSSAALAAPRVSQASLNLSTCGCPTTFVNPDCREETRWALTKHADTTELDNPSGELVIYSIHVEQSPGETNLKGSGQIVITNSGEQTAFLSGLVLNLEESCGGCGDSIGPSGDNWKIWRKGALVRGTGCQLNPARPGYGIVNSCYGSTYDDGSSTIVLRDSLSNDPVAFMSLPGIPATRDNDGDGRRDEDGACGTRGSIAGVDDDLDYETDEDGACEDAVVYNFDYSFDILDLIADGSIQAGDAMRVNLMVTFGGAGNRGGGGASCAVDINCNRIEDCDDPSTPLTNEHEGDWGPACGGVRGDNVRTIQQRGGFTMPACSTYCDSVEFSDLGPIADDDCLTIENVWLPEDPNGRIYAVDEGQSLDFELDTTVSCACGDNLGQLESELEEAEGADGLVTMTCYHPGTGGSTPSYWDCQISNSENPALDGLYDGWCVDIDMTLSPGTPYQAQLVSSYSPEALQFVEYPQNMPNVNYMLNNPFMQVGQSVPGCAGVLTYGDVERAIWAMVEEFNSTAGLGGYSPCRVNWLVQQACGITDDVEDRPGDVVGETCPSGPGSSYEPSCGAIVGVLIVPTTTAGAVAGQVNMVQMPMNLVLDENCYTCTESCDTSLVNTATLTCDEDQALVLGSPATVAIHVTCQGLGPGSIFPGDFCSYTIGGWGSNPCDERPQCGQPNKLACPTCGGPLNNSCNNPGRLLRTHWAPCGSLFPNGITLGDAQAGKWATWTSAEAVEAYLPHGAPAGVYTANLTNPTSTSAGILSSQLLAAMINVAFDDAGIRNPEADPKPAGVGSIRQLVFSDCLTDNPLIGKTVDEVIAIANDVIAGAPDGPSAAGITPTMLNEALSIFNEQFDECELSDFICFENPTAPIR